MSRILTTRELADIVGSVEWRVRRLFQDGTFPEPPKFGGKRAIPAESVPAIIGALRERGWLPEPEREVPK